MKTWQRTVAGETVFPGDYRLEGVHEAKCGCVYLRGRLLEPCPRHDRKPDKPKRDSEE